jgi:ABC-type phosphate transport system substrate-binding protein
MVAAWGAILLAVAPVHAGDAPFKVIVNPSVTGRVLPRTVLAKVYLGDVTHWGNGDAITPVDQSSTSPVRQAFSEQMLGMSIEAVKQHWLRKLTPSTRLLPPKSKATDEEVIAFVAGQPGGVGYVSATATLPSTVREIAVE